MRIIPKLAIVFVTLNLTLCLSVSAEETRLEIDTKKSSLTWKGTKVTGSHTGTLAIKDGYVVLNEGKPKSGEFTFDMQSINNTDLADSPKYKTKLENHLKSDDFFNVAEHSSASFTINSIAPVPTADDIYEIKGVLTVKDISKPLTFKSKITEGKDAYYSDASLKFDRTLWNIKYNSGKFFDLNNLGEKLIYDEVEVSFSLVAPKG